MFNLKAIAISTLCMFSLNANAYGINIDININFLNDIYNEVNDLLLDIPQDLSGVPQTCTICDNSYEARELADLAAFVHDKVYGADASSYPQAGEGKPWIKVEAGDWKNLRVKLNDNTEVMVSADLSRTQGSNIRRGIPTTITLKIVRRNRSVSYVDLQVELGGESRSSAAARHAVEAAYAAFADVGTWLHNNPYFDTNISYFQFNDGFTCLDCFAEWY